MNKYIRDKKVLFEKNENGENRVTLTSVYDKNCSGESMVDVNDEVLFWLEVFVRMENNYNRKLRYNPNGESFDEVRHGEMHGYCEKSFEEEILEKIWLENLLNECGEVASRRAMIAINGNLSMREIAEMDDVHHSSVEESFEQIRDALYKYTELS